MNRKIFTGLVPAVLLIVLCLLAPAQSAFADDQVVTNCSNDTDLRTKINALQSSGGGTLTFNCGTATIILSSVLPTITGNVTIDGGGKITLSGNNAARIFYVSSGAMLSLNRLTLTKAHGAGDGGAIYNNYGTVLIAYSKFIDNTADASGGAIVTYGALTITQSEFAGNKGANGGAIYPRFSQAVTHITNSNFHDNQTTSTTDGWGGAMLLWDGAPATIQNTIFSKNQANYGGAIYVLANSSLTFDHSTADHNEAINWNGGALENHGATTITDSTLSYNSSASVGGAISNDGTLTITRSTLNNNSAPSGGGLYNHSSSPTLTNVTLSGNTAGAGGGIANTKGNPVVVYSTFFGNSAAYGSAIENGTYSYQHFTLKNTVLAGSPQGGNCYDSQSTATILSVGFNLSDDSSCSAYFNQSTDKNNISAMLNPLANNGGFTQTHLPQAGSPLLDNGTGSGAPATDQRGIARPQGAAVDIGAVERCADKPSKPVLVSPGNNTKVKGKTIVLDWNDVPCTQTYTVILKLGSPTGTKVQKKTKLTDSAFTTKALVRGQTYYWQITAVGDAGKSKSAWWSFKVK
jgi:predicted outer membrane repeat protein